jgi:hypothetical protein
MSVAAGDDWSSTRPPAELAAAGAPTIAVEAVDACPVCGAAAAEQLAIGFDYELLTCANPWSFLPWSTTLFASPTYVELLAIGYWPLAISYWPEPSDARA